MKMHYRKLPPKIINSREYKKFSNGNFLISVKEVSASKNQSEENGELDFFLSTSPKILNKHAPCKKSTYEIIRDLLILKT